MGGASALVGLLGVASGSLREMRGREADWSRSTSGFSAAVAGNAVTLLHDGAQTYDAMLEAIAGAREEILLEMYWFGSDRAGWRFANALIERAKAGVSVSIIYDAIGSLSSTDEMWDALRDAGCKVYAYGPIRPWRARFRLIGINRRDHRKILVVDRLLGFTGGLNIGDPWAAQEDGGEGWRDDMIRIEGDAALQLCRVFHHTFAKLAGREVHDRAFGELPPNEKVTVLANFLDRRRDIRSVYLERIRAAASSIFITNAYFIPDSQIRRELAAAHARGVTVRVLLPGNNDVKAVQWASRRLYEPLMARGVHIHEWQGAVLHSKTAVIDGSWCAIGTYNLDHRSFRFNLEVVATVSDRGVGAAMEQKFLEDLQKAEEMNPENFSRRPMSEKISEKIFYLFRKLL